MARLNKYLSLVTDFDYAALNQLKGEFYHWKWVTQSIVHYIVHKPLEHPYNTNTPVIVNSTVTSITCCYIWSRLSKNLSKTPVVVWFSLCFSVEATPFYFDHLTQKKSNEGNEEIKTSRKKSNTCYARNEIKNDEKCVSLFYAMKGGSYRGYVRHSFIKAPFVNLSILSDKLCFVPSNKSVKQGLSNRYLSYS